MSHSPTAFSRAARVHPTALVSPEAVLGERVEIGAYAIVEGAVTLGDGCAVRPHACLYGPLTLGRDNVVHSGAVLGDQPQHLKYQGEPTSLVIGDGNVFREHVTIHRGTTHSFVTRIGNQNFFMANSHVGHDSVVGDRCILANGALVGGHCVLGDSVYLSGNCAVHQFVRLGRLSLLSGCSGTSKDIPPFIIQQGYNTVMGINRVGMRRAGYTNEQIRAVQLAFKIIWRDGMPLPAAIAKVQAHLGEVDVIREMLAFLSGCRKGVNLMRGGVEQEAA